MLLLIIFILSSCAASPSQDPLAGIENAAVGTYTDLGGGRLYLPPGWKAEDREKWPVTVILHGYGTLSRSLSVMPFWIPLAEEYDLVLFFADRGTMGWDERRDSLDTRLIERILRTFRSKSWVRENSIQLFGWSAGAIMAQGFTAINAKQKDGTPLFDSLAAASGGFGLIMDRERAGRGDPFAHSVRVPVYVFWGEAEASDHGKDAADFLTKNGWSVETSTHPGGHVLPEESVREVLSRNRK